MKFNILLTAASVAAMPESFDCEWRKLALSFATSKIPASSTSVYEALQLGPLCSITPPASSPPLSALSVDINSDEAIYVDVNGDDANKGTADSPLRSLQAAVTLSRTTSTPSTILLNSGTYYTPMINLDSRDSGTTFSAAENQFPIISAATPLNNLEWSSHDVTDGKNIWVANIDKDVVKKIPGLHYNKNRGRATVARFPNCDPWIMNEEYKGDQRINEGVATWMEPKDYSSNPGKQILVETPTRNDTADGQFQNYVAGVDGPCEIYDPPTSYWCSNNTQGGGAFTFRVPSGINLSSDFLPNSPYESGAPQVEINAWRPARWANWMFEGDYDSASNSVTFTKGGFQGSRGSDEGGDWFIQNVFEELDFENEFFYDEAENKLYFYYNATSGTPPDNNDNFVVPTSETIFNISATRQEPAVDLTFSKLKLTGTRDTYLNAPHGVPSGGDWALERRGALLAEGTENLLVDGCHFEKVDGHGAFISGYNRHAMISNNEFSWVGGSAIASWGRTDSEVDENAINAKNGDFPRYNNIVGNIAREIGHFEKQNSFYVQAKTAQSVIKDNVFFNGPRAGVNYNDGFGGGDSLNGNLVFNTCRESSDHGPFNSWDRQPYVTDVVEEGVFSTDMLWREVKNNFLVANYQSQEAVDNDDGSAYFETSYNFMVDSSNGMKNDFGGHDNRHHHNIYAYTGKCMQDWSGQIPEHLDYFHDNTCILDGDGGPEYATYDDTEGNEDVWPIMYNNTVYSSNGTTSINGVDLAEYQKDGKHDQGTTVDKLPADSVIIGWAKELLGLN